MTTSMIIAAVLICLGMIFMLASLIGIVRLPDFFTRLHAQGVGDTLGAFLILAGMVAAVGANLLSVKILLIFIIIVLTNPIGTNLMMIAAINKEDYQGYSTLMSGSEHKEQEPALEAEQPELKEKEPAKKAEQPAAKGKSPEAGDKTEKNGIKEQKAEVKKQKTGKNEKAAEAAEQKAAKKEEGRKEKKPGGEQKPKGERKPKVKNKKPDGENKPDGNKKNLKVEQKENKEQKEQKEQKKKGSRRKSNKPSMKMNKTELLAAAAKRGVEVPEGATKREILDLIYSNHDKNRN